jgi:HSP20 family protein
MLTGWTDFDATLRALDSFQRHLDRTFGAWETPAERGQRRTQAVWPLTNVYETKEGFLVRAEVPGMAEGDIAVSVEDDALVVRGERKCEVPQGYKAHLRERFSTAFTRKLPLPARVDMDGVTATLRDGVLTIALPKAKEALPRQITVNAGGGQSAPNALS